MRRLVMLFSVVVLIGTGLAYAQTGNTWPPRPEDLFAPGIEVVSVDPVADNEARILYLYEADGWHAYPYPPDFNIVGVRDDYYGNFGGPRVYRRPDGKWLVFEQDAEMWYRYNTWLLDPNDGAFTRLDPPCGVDRELSDLDQSVLSDALDIIPITRAWVFTWDGAHFRLCSILTEQRSEPLPNDVVHMGSWSTAVLPRVTPDGTRAVFMTYEHSQGYVGQYHFYSYNLHTDELLELGTVQPWPGENEVSIDGWLDDSHFVFTVTAMPEWSGRNLFVGDAAQSDSIGFAASMLRFWPRVITDPPSIEAMDAEMEDGPSTGPCFLQYYDALTRERVLYDTGDLCEYGRPIPDGTGDRLYRGIFPRMTLVRYNLETGARSNLFTGEIEWVGAVSPGGHYAMLGLGNNGIVDMGQDPDPNAMGGCSLFRNLADCLVAYVRSYLIVDLRTGELISEVPPAGSWFTDTTLLVTPSDEPPRLVYLQREEKREQTLPGEVLLPLPERGQILLQGPDGSIDLYTATTGQTMPVMGAAEGVDITNNAREDGTLLVTIRRPVEPDSARVRWTIRLP
jgi:hypothetical protein